jgi:hypothetical protein
VLSACWFLLLLLRARRAEDRLLFVHVAKVIHLLK